MGGKPKQATRTKNNAKPSSSGRSAELLGASVPFVGFKTVENSRVMPIVPGFASNSETMFEDIDPNIEDNFKFVLKKLSKRDPITKQKGLKELSDLIKNSEVETVKPLLPLWPRFYGYLSIDIDNRVREASQHAQAAFLLKTGKHIAPYLKQLAGPWLTSQFDTHAVTASLAVASFKKSFPSKEKQRNFLLFCEQELLEYIKKNLIQHTAQTLSNPKNHTQEESEFKYQRVLVSNLRGYAFYLQTIVYTDHKHGELNISLFDNDKFWSYHKSKNSAIRSAWFEVISSCLQHASEYLVSRYSAITAIAFNNLDESVDIVTPFIWATIVLVQIKIASWHEYIDVHQVVLPTLWKLLRSGGNGNATVIYPHMLPFILKIDETILGDLSEFYLKFFKEMKEGLQKVADIKSECLAISSAYYETLKFVFIYLNSQMKNTAWLVMEKLLDDHIIAVIYWIINLDLVYIKKQIFKQISALVLYLNAAQIENSLYAKFTQRFWSEMYFVLKSTIDNEISIDKTLEAHADLYLSFKQCSPSSQRKTSNVKFLTDTYENDNNCDVEMPLTLLTLDSELNNLIKQMCLLYIEKAEVTHNAQFVIQLEQIAKEFQSQDLFECLANGSSLESLFDMFETWLKTDEGLRSESIIELSLSLLKYSPESKKIEFLQRLAKIHIKEVQYWVLLRYLSHPLNKERCMATILNFPEVKQYLINCAHSVVNNETHNNLDILHKCFFQTETGSILIDNNLCEGIVDTICEKLELNDKLSLDTCASFISQIMPVICNDSKKFELQRRIFLQLFNFSVKNIATDDLSEDTLWEATTTWQDSLSGGDIKLDEQLIKKCRDIICEQISKENSIEAMERISELCSKLIYCSNEGSNESDNEKLDASVMMFKILTSNLKNKFKDDQQMFLDLSLYIEALSDKILTTSLSFDSLIRKDVELDVILCTFLKQIIFKTCLIFKLTCSSKENLLEVNYYGQINSKESENEELKDICTKNDILFESLPKDLFEELLTIIQATTAVDVFIKNGISEINENMFLYLSEKTARLLTELPTNIQKQLKILIFDKVKEETGLWSLSLSLLKNCSSQFSDPENAPIIILEDITEELRNNEKLHAYGSVMQALTQILQPGGLPVLTNLFENCPDLYAKVVAERMLIINHFYENYGDMQHKKIIGNGLIILHELLTQQKNVPFLLYNRDITEASDIEVALNVQIIYLIKEILKHFPTELDTTLWDFVRLALSNWVLSVSKSSEKLDRFSVKLFTTAVFLLFAELRKFILQENVKSSTELLKNMSTEWENVFDKEINLVLLKTFITSVAMTHTNEIETQFYSKLSHAIDWINVEYIFELNKIDSTMTLNDLIEFLIDNVDSSIHSIRVCCIKLLRNMTAGLIKIDLDLLQQNSDKFYDEKEVEKTTNWHILHKFLKKLNTLELEVKQYLKNYGFKLNGGDHDEKDAPYDRAVPYLLVWDCILFICSKAPAELRSTYTTWITKNELEVVLLPFLFELMPREILRNPDTGIVLGQTMFGKINWKQISSDKLNSERFACYIYVESLRSIPVIVRRWWNSLNPRLATLIDKITTNFISTQLCQDEFNSLMLCKDKYENMKIKVSISSRQVTAVYSIDEAKLELVITLPINHPLGPVKVESGKQIGGRLQSRQLVMQCTIFLTHQNGSLWDGLSLWKRNLDRKFEGVEECFICYAVIHQDTCQIPRLTCKTCKKKFHGSCLYRWFNTSNKSTCPICRNMF